jgi:hypothetical protein
VLQTLPAYHARPRARPSGRRIQVERWPIDRLIPYARNSRTHSEAQIAQVAASMKEWGWTNPVLADEECGVIAGHARILAARQLGITEVPVMVARGWTDAQKRAYVIADNQLEAPRRHPRWSAWLCPSPGRASRRATTR